MADDVVFQEAMDALRGGNKTRARELLTGLIKEDQNNAEYWVWMSATMETSKERIYCLQTAFNLNPENASAKRGLILLGALPADETIQPFSLNRARAWEEKLLLAHEKPKLKGWAAVKASPITRLGIVILLIGAVAGGIAFGVVIPAQQRNARIPTNTPPGGNTLTFTATVTVVGGRPQAQQPAGTPNSPLADLVDIPYTVTPLYVQMERSPITSDLVLQFNNAFQKGDWDEAIGFMQQVIDAEPDMVTAYYYLGEAFRLKGDSFNAATAFNTAIEKNKDFGPAYVGLARAQLLGNPNADVLSSLDDAIELDPEFGEAYLERANVKIRDNEIQDAIVDLGEANKLLPNSPLTFYYLAQARLKEGELDLALNAATRANELDLTSMPTYRLLGQINAAMENYDAAVENLTLYLKYQPEDITAFMQLGDIQFKLGNYEEVIQTMDDAIAANRNRSEPYLLRFRANVELGKGAEADQDIDRIIQLFPDTFEANIAILRLHLIQKRNGSALQYFEKTLPLAGTDEQKAQVYYWGAIMYEQRDELKEAVDTWKLLLDLPEDSMTAEMRKVAEEHLADIGPVSKSTETRTPSPTKPVTVTVTKTPSPTRTPTAKP